MTKSEIRLIQRKYIKAQARIIQSRNDFWMFCRTLSPRFYTRGNHHLIYLCDTLENLYFGKLKKPDGTPFKKLMINMPPQHGKTRTLIHFCQWVLGRDNEERIILGSYNDDTASDFSRYTRDGIETQKNLNEIVYRDIFSETKIKQGNAAFKKWALEGQHFNYLGAGIHGSITSKGGTILIIDDPIKGAEEAFNENHLEKVYRWYTGTFLSRVAAKAGEPLEIICMTRWSKNDLCGRILHSDPDDWYKITMKAYDPEKDEMLCPSLLGKKRYASLQKVMVPEILEANYNQEPIDIKGRLYKSFKTYTDVPRDNQSQILFEQVANYTDTADEGSHYLCSINFGIYRGEAYVLDVLYSKDGMEITEAQTADMLVNGKVNQAHIESNNGGRGFARNVERLIWERHHTKSVNVKWFHQSGNKKSRILSNSSFVQEHIYFPSNWADKWPEFYRDLSSYQKEGKNKYDDGPDTITGIAETINNIQDWSGVGAIASKRG